MRSPRDGRTLGVSHPSGMAGMELALPTENAQASVASSGLSARLPSEPRHPRPAGSVAPVRPPDRLRRSWRGQRGRLPGDRPWSMAGVAVALPCQPTRRHAFLQVCLRYGRCLGFQPGVAGTSSVTPRLPAGARGHLCRLQGSQPVFWDRWSARATQKAQHLRRFFRSTYSMRCR